MSANWMPHQCTTTSSTTSPSSVKQQQKHRDENEFSIVEASLSCDPENFDHNYRVRSVFHHFDQGIDGGN
jgi:hypothetical protein